MCLFPLPYYREDGETIYEMGTVVVDVTAHLSYQVLPSDGSYSCRYALGQLYIGQSSTSIHEFIVDEI